MTNEQRLAKLLRAEAALKKTTVGFDEGGPNWRVGMPLLWEVRLSYGVQSAIGRKLAEAHGILKQTQGGYNPYAPRWKAAFEIIDKIEDGLVPVPYLGPVIRGEKPMALWAPTHQTGGLKAITGSYYPAFDSAFGKAGAVVLAPERMRVRKQSSAQGADAFYAIGVSGLEYWIGHIVRAPATGTWLDRGEKISEVARIAAKDGGPHLHVGVDARKLIGRDLRWGRRGNGPDYSFGSPAYGVQLAAALAA